METKEYIVALNFGVDYLKFWTEIESGTSGSPFLPNRPVSIINSLDAMETLCHYALTDQEAELLSQDSRVAAVDIPADQDPTIIVNTGVVHSGNYNKPGTESTGDNINWGLVRHSNVSNRYSTGKPAIGYYGQTTNSNYTAVLDGTGVDIVVMDTGIEALHPEFQDANGNSRVVQYNWTGSLDTSIGSPAFQDLNGHGTHCAGIAAGKTYGWAKNAKIYPMRITLSDTIASGGLTISFDQGVNYIKAWHIRKNTPGDPIYTGRPTIINLSIQSSHDLVTEPPVSITYKGTTAGIEYIPFNNGVVIKASAADPSKGLIKPLGGLAGPPRRIPTRENSIQELTNAGIVVCICAGNHGYKIDSYSTDVSADYNNYYTTSGGLKKYYHQGSSPNNPPTSTNKAAIIVGNLFDGYGSSLTEIKNPSSNAGPGVDIFAAGTSIRSAVSNISDQPAVIRSYFKDSNFKQMNMTGTSMACPQIAGMCALYLQHNPTATPKQVKEWLLRNAIRDKFYKNPDSSVSNDYATPHSQFGGNTGIAYMDILGLSYVKDQSGAWKPVNRKYIKTATGWQGIKYSYIKTVNGWVQTANPM